MPRSRGPARFQASAERGNAFVLIMLGVVLFAALVFTFSRGLNTGSDKLSENQARVLAQDLLTWSAQVERAVQRLAEKGISESDISFENPVVAGYAHMPAVATSARVFDSEGGMLNWKTVAPRQNDGSPWLMTGGLVVGTLGSTAASELMMILPGLGSQMCAEVNRQLGLSTAPGAVDSPLPTGKFTGTYGDAVTDDITVAGFETKPAGCVRDAAGELGGYFFYRVLLTR